MRKCKTKHYCKSCNKEISYNSAKYGTHLCRSCSVKNRYKNPKNNPNYRHGKCVDPKCMDCGKKRHPQAKRCRKCESKNHSILLTGINNFMYGKHHSKKSKEKISNNRKNKGIGRDNSQYVFISKNFLIEQYDTKEKTIRNIAKILKCGKKAVSKRMEEYSIPARNPSDRLKGDKCGRWIDGRSERKYPYEFNNKLKNKIRERDNHICQKCGTTEEKLFILSNENLTVHHIDYDKNNCKEHNLTSLCRSCNSKVNSNRGYWKEYFQLLLKILT